MSALIRLLDRPIAYNPAFAKLKAGKVKAGPVAAVFLSQLVYWHNRMDGGWMYKTQADITSETALTRDEQETARKRLIVLGVLEEDRRGVPATMHYRINTERLEALLVEAAGPEKKAGKDKTVTRLRSLQNVETPQSGLVQSRKLDCGDAANKNVETPQSRTGETHEQACGDPANFHTGDYTENTQEITQDIKPLCPVTSEPDPEVVITDQAIDVLTHLNRVSGSRYQKSKTSLENIRARIREGYSVHELKLVIDLKHEHWHENDEQYQYMRPETLFGPKKFESYLQSATRWDAKGRPPRSRWGDRKPDVMTFGPVDKTIPKGFRG
ncbi:conserved phage C-terminal domain-containing protein [Trabulsiella odontotermitis]|uniref:conserved phage C-terminal domain-containing protein n=1 Tax=Trabulsiella odontotermitis TaxID=379893 RepID=UPI0024B836BC|nr:conserved phage C-terminal domain-containing protein [Trabulsiella odontotermitis]WHP32819.1 conserved phage C-terminal domain-containing protein [Trabulsiella odontotermitis]